MQAKKLLTLKQAAEMLAVSAQTLRRWDDKGYLVAIRLGTANYRYYRRQDIEKLLKKRKT